MPFFFFGIFLLESHQNTRVSQTSSTQGTSGSGLADDTIERADDTGRPRYLDM
ncbi:hypothetical protein DPMN_094459 [Dreissena polymorpha]|uniref:Uncharacterized protein n=1 Tax=Dreissena polymorpha TaxID=45954 RepID=A0A9D4R3J7_DREPO|nr:hypothetical protein DPMN_094459 [Dreissena polymorpha]